MASSLRFIVIAGVDDRQSEGFAGRGNLSGVVFPIPLRLVDRLLQPIHPTREHPVFSQPNFSAFIVGSDICIADMRSLTKNNSGRPAGKLKLTEACNGKTPITVIFHSVIEERVFSIVKHHMTPNASQRRGHDTYSKAITTYEKLNSKVPIITCQRKTMGARCSKEYKHLAPLRDCVHRFYLKNSLPAGANAEGVLP